MIDKKDVSIIIQGKLNRVSLNSLSYYKTFGGCVVSAWDSDDVSILKDYDLNGVDIVVNNIKKQPINNPGNIYMHVLSSYNAIKKVKTKFVIKTRSDESFSNLDHIVDLINKDESNIIMGSPHFEITSRLIYHGGDHVFSGKTKTIKYGLALIKRFFDTNFGKYPFLKKQNLESIDRPEQYFTTAFLYVNGCRFLDNNNDYINNEMINNITLCKFKELGDLHYTCNGAGYVSKFFSSGSFPDDFEQHLGLNRVEDIVL